MSIEETEVVSEEAVLDSEDQLLADAGIVIEEETTDESAATETTTEVSEPTAERIPETQGESQPVNDTREISTAEYAKLLQDFAYSNLPQDSQGNLVHPETGQVVARAGAERYFFEQARNAKGFLTKLEARQRETEQLGRQFEAQVQAYERAHEFAKQNNITPEDQHTALQLLAAYRQNPAAAIKYILTDAQANGNDLSEILGDSSINVGAIGQLIDQKLAPITTQAQQTQQATKAEAEATKVAEQFLQDFPDAEVHMQPLAEIVIRQKNPNPREAYYQLREWATRQGLDWSKPLPEQIAERRNSQPRQQSMPSRQHSGAAVQSVNDASLSSDASSGDIVREAMREAGLEI